MLEIIHKIFIVNYMVREDLITPILARTKVGKYF